MPDLFTYSLIPTPDVPANAAQRRVDTLDINRDGYGDLVITYLRNDNVDAPIPITIYFGTAGGSFTDVTATLFPGGAPLTTFVREVTIRDINGDGYTDIFLPDTGNDFHPYPGYQNTLLLGTAAGGLINATANLPQLADYTHSAAVGDIDGDGDIDLWIGNLSGTSGPAGEVMTFAINNGSGVFTSVTSGDFPDNQTEPGSSPASALFDADQDGDLDLFLTSSGDTSAGHVSNENRLFLNDGAGHFSLSPVALPAGPWPAANGNIAIDVEVMDLNGDSRPDVFLTVNQGNPFYIGTRYQVLINQGGGAFADQSSTYIVTQPDTGTSIFGIQDTYFFDYDRDGALDFIGFFGFEARLYINDGANHFYPWYGNLFSDGPYTRSFQVPALLDVNHDGWIDFVSTNRIGEPQNQQIQVALRIPDAVSTVTGTAASEAVVGDLGDDTLSGLGGNDLLSGGDGADTLDGGANDDVLNGGAGNDTLVGGAGTDRLRGGDGTDNLNGGADVDVAVYGISAASAAFARGASGPWTVSAGAEGTDVLSSVEYLDFTDRDLALRPAEGTVDGNGTSDILLRHSGGALALWMQNGATTTGASIIAATDTSYSVVGSGDFNGDGRFDLLFRNAGGILAQWQLDGASVSGQTAYVTDPNWAIVGIGDFNGDFRDDILYRHSGGLLAQWQMNGLATSAVGVFAASDPAWSLASVADFNGDGRDDLLWRHSSGALAQWSMNGFAATNLGVFAISDNAWSIAGTGDFNGDLREDILWRHSSGLLAEWTMDGTSVTGVSVVAVSDPAWAVSDIGDYNGDGRDDILWQGPDGTFALWTLNGFAVLSSNIIGNPGAGWSDIG